MIKSICIEVDRNGTTGEIWLYPSGVGSAQMDYKDFVAVSRIIAAAKDLFELQEEHAK